MIRIQPWKGFPAKEKSTYKDPEAEQSLVYFRGSKGCHEAGAQ